MGYPSGVWAWSGPDLMRGAYPGVESSAAPETGEEPVAQTLVGYRVQAVDGAVGSVASASIETDTSYLAISRPWIFGRDVLLPAAAVDRIDHANGTVYINRTRQEVKDAPKFDPETFRQPEYRHRVEDYYNGLLRSSAPRG